MAVDVQARLRRLSALKSMRTPHEYVWRDCFDHSFTMRGSGLQQNSLTASQALDKKSRIVDSTATDAGTILASALQSGMTPANSRWQSLEVFGADDEGKRWLDLASENLHQEIHNSNFDSIGLECHLDMVGAGWFAMFVDVDHEVGGLHFEGWPIAQCYPATSRAGGLVDTIYRIYNLTAYQAAEFAEKRGGQVSDIVSKRIDTDPDSMVEMLHYIGPRPGAMAGGKMSKNLPFESLHIETQSQHLVLESGFEEFPCVVPRWSLIPDTPYAVGPMFNVLPDVRELNELKRIDKAASEIAVMGMWIAEDDGVLNPRTIKVGARKVIVANSVDSMKPLQTGANWQLADTRIAQLQAQIRKILMADQLQPQGGPQMTATEIHARVALMRQQLGPLFGRMQAEYLQGLVNRTFMLGYRAGVFGQAPQSLAGKNFTIKYISPLAKSQKLEDVSSIQQFNAAIAPVAAVKPEIMDNIDFDDQTRSLAEGLGIPMSGLRTREDVSALRQARSQQQAAAAQQAQQQQLTTMATQTALDTHKAQATAAA
jgi:hypothetical protein